MHPSIKSLIGLLSFVFLLNANAQSPNPASGVATPAGKGPFEVRTDKTNYANLFEGDQFLVTGNWTVYYGVPTIGYRQISGTGPQAISCSIAGFGGDPTPGLNKRCYIPEIPNVAMGFYCSQIQCRPLYTDAKVYYGAGTQFATRDYSKGQSVNCNSTDFSVDPAPRQSKNCFVMFHDYSPFFSYSLPSDTSILAATDGQSFTVNGPVWTVYYEGIWSFNHRSPKMTSVSNFGDKTFVCNSATFTPSNPYNDLGIAGSGKKRCFVDGLNLTSGITIKRPDTTVSAADLPLLADGRVEETGSFAIPAGQAWTVYKGNVFNSSAWTKSSGIGGGNFSCGTPHVYNGGYGAYCYYVFQKAPTYLNPVPLKKDSASTTPARLVIAATLPGSVTSTVNDGTRFMVNGTYWTVYYGVDNSWVQTTGSGPKIMTCGLSTFGTDPAVGKAKTCKVFLTEYPDRSGIDPSFVRTSVTTNIPSP